MYTYVYNKCLTQMVIEELESRDLESDASMRATKGRTGWRCRNLGGERVEKDSENCAMTEKGGRQEL